MSLSWMWPAFELLQTYLIEEWKKLDMAPKNIPTKRELPSPEETRVVRTGCTPFAVPKTLPKPADAPTQPTVPAADESSTGNSLQGDCADAPDTAQRKNLSVSKMQSKVQP